ncbi:MAG: AraC family transcriptional regulator [Acidobacteriales bacterium]|nr:AraC family transcriptional regulator [Terriglobales bacterium]
MDATPIDTNTGASCALDHRIKDSLSYIKVNLDDPPTTTAVAATVHLSPSRFAHLFKTEMGFGIAAYIKSLRLAKAASLLRSTDRSIKDIALSLHYDQSHFTRDFRREYGTPPSKYRDTSSHHAVVSNSR